MYSLPTRHPFFLSTYTTPTTKTTTTTYPWKYKYTHTHRTYNKHMRKIINPKNFYHLHLRLFTSDITSSRKLTIIQLKDNSILILALLVIPFFYPNHHETHLDRISTHTHTHSNIDPNIKQNNVFRNEKKKEKI